jgi:hypothetical protein
MVHRDSGLARYSLVNEIYGGRVVTALKHRHAEKMQSVRLLRLHGKDGSVNIFGALKLPGTLQPGGHFKRLGHGSHRVPNGNGRRSVRLQLRGGMPVSAATQFEFLAAATRAGVIPACFHVLEELHLYKKKISNHEKVSGRRE